MKIDLKTIGYINTFEKLTGIGVKGCFSGKGEQLIFIINKDMVGKAIGKKGENIRKLSNLFKKKLKVIGFDEDVTEFIKNAIYPLKSPKIIKEGNTVVVKTDSKQLKGLLIGRDRQNLKLLQEIVSKYFDVEIKIK